MRKFYIILHKEVWSLPNLKEIALVVFEEKRLEKLLMMRPKMKAPAKTKMTPGHASSLRLIGHLMYE